MQHPRRLVAALLTASSLILMSAPGPARAAAWTDASTAAVNYKQTQDKVRAEVLDELNRMRSSSQSCGGEAFAAASALTLNVALNNAAYLHSQDMAVLNYFSHTSKDGRTFDQRMTAAGYTWWTAGENIAAGQRDAGEVVAAWMDSPGHCRNIMNPRFKELGVGVYYDAGADFRIYWTNNFGEGTSVPVDDVTPVAPVTKPEVTAAVPQIGGTVKVGKKLTAKAGSWGPKGVKLSYQWRRGGKKISGATGSSYTLKAADLGTSITVTVTGALDGYVKASATSAATAKVGKGSLSAAKPTISGTAKVGKKLTAKPGTWKPSGVKRSYRWLRNGKSISGATKSTYTLKKADVGKKISVKVTGKKSGYTTKTVSSKATAAVKK